MNRIAAAAPEIRGPAFAEAGIWQGMAAAIIEKDFWVCWMLGQLFGHTDWSKVLVFKGGTSLSKVFNAIRRFSEDIDLSLSPLVLGITTNDINDADNRKKRDTLMKKMEDLCSDWVGATLLPELETSVQSILGSRPGGQPWLEYERDDASHSPVIYFHYPSDHADGLPYIRRSVKLEFGSLTDQQPTGTHKVRPWVAAALPEAMREMGCNVIALEVERAFWEKATILHAEHHRDIHTPMPARYSRHYADLAALVRSGHAEKALLNPQLRQRVVDWKAQFFARSWARYDLAKPDSFRLLPPEGRLTELERDYREMREMFVDEAPPFSDIMTTLKALEDRINEGS